MKDWSCEVCTEAVRDELGCRTETEKPIFEVAGILLHRCPFSLVNTETDTFVRCYVMAEKFGVLPFSGGWLEQSSKFVLAFNEFAKIVWSLKK